MCIRDSRMGVDASFRALDLTRTVAALAAADVVVSTLPPGAADAVAADLAGPVHGVLLDCAYHPRQTALVRAWQRCGGIAAVSYTHLRAHETPEHLVCRL